MTTLTRRALLQSIAAMPLASWAVAQGGNNPDVAYGNTTIPAGIRSRLVTGVNGITMHALEAGFETANRPAVLLIHGFPELGYSWRHVMLPLAKAGYHVIAPDQRGYGRSGGTDRHLRPGPGAVLDAQSRPRHDGVDQRFGTSLGRDGGRA
jgi:predicted alpha/beta-fold hydrolase